MAMAALAGARPLHLHIRLPTFRTNSISQQWKIKQQRKWTISMASGEDEVPTNKEIDAEPSSIVPPNLATPPPPPPPPQVPTKNVNRVIALVSAAAAVCLFFVNRGTGFAPGLGDLSAKAVPYEEAIQNGKPTVVEFYADWCEVCREMARDVYSIEEKYKDRVNFVMLNVDNSKWESELDDFGVEGIPHFAFLDAAGNEEGNIVGRLPSKFLAENVDALARGEASVPHSRAVGKFSGADSRQPPRIVSPRTHG